MKRSMMMQRFPTKKAKKLWPSAASGCHGLVLEAVRNVRADRMALGTRPWHPKGDVEELPPLVTSGCHGLVLEAVRNVPTDRTALGTRPRHPKGDVEELPPLVTSGCHGLVLEAVRNVSIDRTALSTRPRHPEREAKALRLLAIAMALCVAVFAVTARADELVRADKMVVIAGHPDAAKLGEETLKKGGNAIDALVTTSLALNVAEPGNSGLGGKIVCLYYDAKTKQTTTIIAMDSCPANLPVEEFLKLPADHRERGWKTICTPGLAAALGEAHAKWGAKAWKDDVQPVVELATNGVVLSDRAAAMLSQYKPEIDPAAAAIYASGGKPLPAGATMKNPDLAHTMQIIADQGYRAFYEGDIAQRLVDAAKAGGGYLSLDDLRNYHARFVEPLQGDYRGYTIQSSPPPLTGGVTLLAALKCLQHDKLSDMHPRDTKEIDLLSRVMEQVYPEVQLAAADYPESAQRCDQALSADNIDGMYERAIKSDPKAPLTMKSATTKKATAGVGPSADAIAEGPTWDHSDQGSTTQMIIVDQDGDIVCETQSLGIHFGAAVVAPGDGFLLNADTGNFSTVASSKNYLAPARWPRSTMTPTIVFKDQQPYLVIGSPAAERIPTAVLQVTMEVLDFNRPLLEAIRAPRFHIRHAASKGDHPNDIDMEGKEPDPLLDGPLTSMGWSLHWRDDSDFYFGSVCATEMLPGGHMLAVADQRRTSDVEGE